MKAMPKAGYLHVPSEVKLRKEHFGGLVFHGLTGTTLEVDDEAFQLLCQIRQNGPVFTDTLANSHASEILPTLLAAEIFELTDNIQAGMGHAAPDARDYGTDELSAPETVHLAITYRCGEICPDCYARGRLSGEELGTSQINAIIDDIANEGVFQLAIGGGEPLIRSDLIDIARHAAGRGLAVHITTGKHRFESKCIPVLQHIKSLHIGIRPEPLIIDSSNTAINLCKLANYAKQAGIHIGANIIITRFAVQNLNRLVEMLVSYGFQRLIFLRYKPHQNLRRFCTENPDEALLNMFNDGILRIRQEFPMLSIRLDCAAAFFMKNVEKKIAVKAGIKGCVAANRILSVSPDGSVYPCSQLHWAKHCAGNLMQNPLRKIWQESDVLRSFRNFRQTVSFENSVCGKCQAKEHCGGCRVFAPDSFGGEPFCPLG